MKHLLLILLSIVALSGRAQKLPDMGLSRYVFVQSMTVSSYTFDIRDTASACFGEGHWICEVVDGQCKRQRTIEYGTFLFNGGDTVGVYGYCVLPHCQYDFCHHHDHFTEGIRVLLERWNPVTRQWVFVSFNSKLDYAMANDTKYPANYVAVTNPITGEQDHVWQLSNLYDEQDYMSNTVGVMDSSLARTRDAVWNPTYDQFYTYQTVDYNSNFRGVVHGYGDLYWLGTEGNANHLTDSVDGFYRFTLWHNPPFPQKNIWPDTISNILYLQGDVIVSRDTTLPEYCDPTNPDPSTIGVIGNIITIPPTGACDMSDCEIILVSTKLNREDREIATLHTFDVTDGGTFIYDFPTKRELRDILKNHRNAYQGWEGFIRVRVGNTIKDL